ncbi:Arc family DNA-binding protein [Devosia sp. 2618]|uniref:Arc family DNA-binding protein n=1 Tax=Devosia sp. 2618 TaxID=3156454 RepID=UPI00339A3802
MSREDPQMKLRLPEQLRDVLKAKADESHRSMNAEIVARLEQSLEFSITVGLEFQQAMAKATEDKLDDFREDLASLLNAHFPNAVIEMTPEQFWQMGMANLEDVPADFVPILREKVLQGCRLLAKDPNWLPPEERQ